MTTRESWAVGIGMNARGAVELIVADVAFRAGLFAVPNPPAIVASLYSAVAITAIVTTLATPIRLRWLYRSPSRDGAR